MTIRKVAPYLVTCDRGCNQAIHVQNPDALAGLGWKTLGWFHVCPSCVAPVDWKIRLQDLAITDDGIETVAKG